jgi:hypothetical protein
LSAQKRKETQPAGKLEPREGQPNICGITGLTPELADELKNAQTYKSFKLNVADRGISRTTLGEGVTDGSQEVSVNLKSSFGRRREYAEIVYTEGVEDPRALVKSASELLLSVGEHIGLAPDTEMGGEVQQNRVNKDQQPGLPDK